MKIKFVNAEDFEAAYSYLSSDELFASRDFTDSDFDFGDFEVAFAYSSGCIVLRYYSEDAGYHFDAPFELTDGADIAGAFLAISEYCVLERITETVVGISEDRLEMMIRGAKEYSITEDDDGTFAVRIFNECMLLDDVPECLCDNVYLGELCSVYADEYEKMIKNENLNLHFGYNILDDMPNGTGIDFIKNANLEFENGEAITLAATVFLDEKNVFVGEGTLFGFDGRGNASVSFRVLPEYQKKGIGSSIMKGLVEIAKKIGLKRLRAEVKKENYPSLNLMKKFAEPLTSEGTFVFEISI